MQASGFGVVLVLGAEQQHPPDVEQERAVPHTADDRRGAPGPFRQRRREVGSCDGTVAQRLQLLLARRVACGDRVEQTNGEQDLAHQVGAQQADGLGRVLHRARQGVERRVDDLQQFGRHPHIGRHDAPDLRGVDIGFVEDTAQFHQRGRRAGQRFQRTEHLQHRRIRQPVAQLDRADDHRPHQMRIARLLQHLVCQRGRRRSQAVARQHDSHGGRLVGAHTGQQRLAVGQRLAVDRIGDHHVERGRRQLAECGRRAAREVQVPVVVMGAQPLFEVVQHGGVGIDEQDPDHGRSRGEKGAADDRHPPLSGGSPVGLRDS